MARNQNQTHPFDEYIDNRVRTILRQEFARMFSGESAEDEVGEPQASPSTLDAGGETSSGRSTSGKRGGRRKKRTNGRGKGKATNPATDRRFKANREAEA